MEGGVLEKRLIVFRPLKDYDSVFISLPLHMSQPKRSEFLQTTNHNLHDPSTSGMSSPKLEVSL